MRMYDPRIGRPISVDPLFKKYPELSTYQFFSNNPIYNIDLDGLEGCAANLLTPGHPNYHLLFDANDDGLFSEDEKYAREKVSIGCLKITVYSMISPQVAIPLLLTDITGNPVTPSPQAFEVNVPYRINQAEQSEANSLQSSILNNSEVNEITSTENGASDGIGIIHTFKIQKA
jgi:hypothetical protein